jgi:hypothetical protein
MLSDVFAMLIIFTNDKFPNPVCGRSGQKARKILV